MIARPDVDDWLIAEAWCKALQGFSWYSNPPRDQRRLSEEAPLEDTGRPKLFMVILQFDATCSALCKATEQYREDISIHCLQCLVQGYKEQYREDIVFGV